MCAIFLGAFVCVSGLLSVFECVCVCVCGDVLGAFRCVQGLLSVF